jgi:hypothetical protein
VEERDLLIMLSEREIMIYTSRLSTSYGPKVLKEAGAQILEKYLGDLNCPARG